MEHVGEERIRDATAGSGGVVSTSMGASSRGEVGFDGFKRTPEVADLAFEVVYFDF